MRKQIENNLKTIQRNQHILTSVATQSSDLKTKSVEQNAKSLKTTLLREEQLKILFKLKKEEEEKRKLKEKKSRDKRREQDLRSKIAKLQHEKVVKKEEYDGTYNIKTFVNIYKDLSA